jgi:D-3-phosphoglycerate dehydrogenase
MHILITDNLHPSGLAILDATTGITYHAPEKISRAEVLETIATADGLIIRSGTKANAELLAKATALKAIVRAGVGVDNVDLDAATAQNIVVMNTPQGNAIATAELTLGLMLSLARFIPAAHQSLKEGRWDRKSFTGTELRNKTLGLVGFGRIGRAVAHRAQAFAMQIVYYDPYLPGDFSVPNTTRVHRLAELYAQADYLSLHSVATDETRHMINAESITQMKDGVRIINAARGTLIDAEALAEALKVGKVAGAALDVYEEEPPPASYPLLGLPNVVHTPHLGASTDEAQEDVAVEAAQLMVNALLHEIFDNVVNPAVLVV